MNNNFLTHGFFAQSSRKIIIIHSNKILKKKYFRPNYYAKIFLNQFTTFVQYIKPYIRPAYLYIILIEKPITN